MESFLSNDEDARDIFAPSKNSPAEHNTDTSKGTPIINYLIICSVSLHNFHKQGPNSRQVSVRLLVIKQATTKFSAVISPQMAHYWPVLGMKRR